LINAAAGKSILPFPGGPLAGREAAVGTDAYG